LEALTTPVVYDAREASELLAAAGVPPCPVFGSYVERLVDYVKQRGRAREGDDADAPPGAEERPS
jgi:hypothetical protein